MSWTAQHASESQQHRGTTLASEIATHDASQSHESWFDRLLRRGVLNHFQQLQSGCLSLISDETVNAFGEAGAELAPQLQIRSPRFFSRVALGGSLGFAESYILGEWTCDDLTSVLRVFARNISVSDAADRGVARLMKWFAKRWHERRVNSEAGSAANIHAHYDLGNDFYSLFLDDTMTYSCGVFETPESTLHEASVAKVDRLCRKLDLKPTDHLLEIGTGWGYLAVHAARNYGCRVTTTTISREQYEFACRRVAEAGVADRVTLLLQDYRKLTGQYDKLVSVEMIEAVGFQYFDTFFSKCGELLKPDGQMAIQGITMSEQRYPRYLKSVDFIQRYIFPGGCLITPSTVLQSVTRTTDMRCLHIEDMAPHYARTLRLWRDNFFARLDDVRTLGFPVTFIRLWEYYLCYCEAAFTERLVGTVQMHLAKPRCLNDGMRPFL